MLNTLTHLVSLDAMRASGEKAQKRTCDTYDVRKHNRNEFMRFVLQLRNKFDSSSIKTNEKEYVNGSAIAVRTNKWTNDECIVRGGVQNAFRYFGAIVAWFHFAIRNPHDVLRSK